MGGLRHFSVSPSPLGTNWKARVQVQSPSPMSNGKGKEEFGLWAVSKILWAAQPTTFKHAGGL